MTKSILIQQGLYFFPPKQHFFAGIYVIAFRIPSFFSRLLSHTQKTHKQTQAHTRII